MVTPAHGEQAFAGQPCSLPTCHLPLGEKVNCDSHLAELGKAGTPPAGEKKMCKRVFLTERCTGGGNYFTDKRAFKIQRVNVGSA